jgi:hypothetical protein
MFESAEDQELLAIADNGIPQQAGFVDFQGAFQGMCEWFINMVETTYGLSKDEIIDELYIAERDADGRI